MDDPEHVDPEADLADLEVRRREAWRSVREAGGGEQEGFEMAEEELIEHTSHGDGHSPARIMRDAAAETDQPTEIDENYGEADEEHKPD
jgi:hypothetical protein